MVAFMSLNFSRIQQTVKTFASLSGQMSLKCLFLGLSLLAAMAVQADSLSSDALSKMKFKKPKIDQSSDINVNADRMTANYDEGTTSLLGNVVITFSDITMTCDKATYNYTTGDIDAEGNIEIVSKSGGSWKGESISFNHKTGQGLVGTGLLRLGQFAVLADSLARDEDGIAYARNATVTTCTNEMSAWHWSVTGEGRFKSKEFLEMKNAVVRFCDIPVLWAPYYYRDLNTHYGWRVMPGYTSKWGAYLLTAYVYPIAGSIEDDGLLYGKTAVDLRSEYGVAVGQEFTWRTLGGLLGEDTVQRGSLSVYVARHGEDEDMKDDRDRAYEQDLEWQRPYGDYRYTIGLSERIDFTPRDHISVEAEYTSDSRFRTDYKELAVRKVSEPVGLANYEHRENTWVSSLAVGGPLNSFYPGTLRLPEFRLDTLPQNVFNIPKLYYESQTSIGFFERQAGKSKSATREKPSYKPGNWAYYESARLDTRHILRRPFELADGITLTPRMGWRGTYYADAPMDDSYFRSLFELGLALQARYWKDFDNYRHTFIPYLDFTCVPGSQTEVDEVPYAFDRLDQEYEWRDRYASDGLTPSHRYTGLRFGTRNLLQRRTKEDTLTRFLNFDLYGIYVFKTDDHWVRWKDRQQPGRDNLKKKATRVRESDGLRVLGFDTIFSPTRNIDFVTDFQYDPEESRLAFWDIGVRARMKAFTFYVGYLSRDHELYDYYWTTMGQDAILYGGFVHSIWDTMDWSLYARYNVEWESLEEIGGYVQYNLDCVSFRLTTEYLPTYVAPDGDKFRPDLKVSLGAWLRAFPMDDDDDWMGWGNFAHMNKLKKPEE